MLGTNNKFICIAGKNQCSVEFVKFLIKKIDKKYILICPNDSDSGHDNWQPSLKKFARKNKIKITTLKKLYKIKNLIFISIEFEKIININLFKSSELYNFHFSILPKFRGCHTNFYQVLYGEKKIGITLHKIDNGIDTGPIGPIITFKQNFKDNARNNYVKLMKFAVKLFKREFLYILNNKITFVRQNIKKGSYFSRKSINYNNIKFIKKINNNMKTYNLIRSLIFPPFQYPIFNDKEIGEVIYKNKKIVLKYLYD